MAGEGDDSFSSNAAIDPKDARQQGQGRCLRLFGCYYRVVPILRRIRAAMVSRQPTTAQNISRRWPVGVEVVHRGDGSFQTHARVWAPACQSVQFVINDDRGGSSDSVLTPEPGATGYFSGLVPGAPAGTRYRFRLDHGDAFSDPASRFQPDGPHGPSMIVDPTNYAWSDAEWSGLTIDGQVLYELHIGTFTKAGTYRAAIERLADLVDVGVTVIELMPVADFTGRFGWGYDGVNLFAPTHLYGTPDDLRAFIDSAHRLKLGVILDVVYNHFGPDGNYLTHFAPRYFSGKRTEWGDAINFDGEDARPVREYFIMNAAYWITEFHLDGLRLDATQQIFDESTPHILAEIGTAARDAAGDRGILLVAENEPQRSVLVRTPAEQGYGLSALWNDDFHHSARVAATGRNEAYFSGYRGSAQEFVSVARFGYLYQGQWYAWQHHRRGMPALDLPAARFVNFIQNHDQVANSTGGCRLHQETTPGRWRALTALLLLLPQTPMLFQGQEFAASSPFLYFADHTPELAALVRAGRLKFLSQFPSIASDEGLAAVSDPADSWTFVRSKLDWAERADPRHRQALDLHRDLLRLRREDPTIRVSAWRRPEGAVIGERSFVLRYVGDRDEDRLLVVNLNDRLHADPIAEPIVAPPTGCAWTTIFSTESPKYGGWGTPPIETADDGWWIPAESAALLAPMHAETTAR